MLKASQSFTFITFYRKVTWDCLIRTLIFSKPSDQYNHHLAKLLLRLALTSFRDSKNTTVQENHLLEFLKAMDFAEIESDTYRKEPEPDSIAYVLAEKKIGDFTLLACAVCGGNYGAEWASNLTVGDEERSEGFNDASGIVQEAIKDYLKRHPSDGPVKLWIAGFSRAAAVSNITAADFTSNPVFFEDIYATCTPWHHNKACVSHPEYITSCRRMSCSKGSPGRLGLCAFRKRPLFRKPGDRFRL